jgi:hypothetical protein
LRLRLYGYNDHDNLNHGYILIGYLNIDIKNTVYSNSRTPVNSVLRHHLRSRHSRCDCGREERRDTKGTSGVPTHQRRS